VVYADSLPQYSLPGASGTAAQQSPRMASQQGRSSKCQGRSITQERGTLGAAALLSTTASMMGISMIASMGVIIMMELMALLTSSNTEQLKR